MLPHLPARSSNLRYAPVCGRGWAQARATMPFLHWKRKASCPALNRNCLVSPLQVESCPIGSVSQDRKLMAFHVRTALSIVAIPEVDDYDVVRPPCWDSTFHQAVKRLMDVLGAGSLLIVFFPLFLFLAIIVRVGSPGNIFYRWRVVGIGVRPFLSYKFRSMVNNADDLKATLEASNEMRGPVFKITNDPRVTRAGKWIRRYSLDELPQLYSVLKGEMSLVR